MLTGINVTVHCWFVEGMTGEHEQWQSSVYGDASRSDEARVPSVKRVIRLSPPPWYRLCVDRQACQCVEHLKSNMGNLFRFKPQLTTYGYSNHEAWFRDHMLSLTSARNGGVADVYLGLRTQWILNTEALLANVALHDILEGACGTTPLHRLILRLGLVPCSLI